MFLYGWLYFYDSSFKFSQFFSTIILPWLDIILRGIQILILHREFYQPVFIQFKNIYL